MGIALLILVMKTIALRGGPVYFAFPALYASSFSGFYLPLMMVLSLLILRGTSVEFRSHVVSAFWLRFGMGCLRSREFCQSFFTERRWGM
jgi:cytochrome d ubiquinol oxidase subunit II